MLKEFHRPQNSSYSLTFTEFSDFYGGEEKISNIDRVLCHEGAVVRNTIKHNPFGVL